MGSSSNSLEFANIFSRLLRTLGVQNIKGKGTEQQEWDSTRWSSWFRHCATNRKVASSISDGVIRIFHFFRPHCGFGTNSISNRNKYRKYFLGVKAAGT
jgi:hypothetical protein